MSHLTRTHRLVLALAIWGAGLVLFMALGYWNVETSRQEWENRLIGEAGQVAGQLASLLSLPAWNLDELSSHIIVTGAMEDERIYAISLQGPEGLQDGQRRNYLWEPVPWDGEISENCVQGIAPIRMGGEIVGKLEVWLSPRLGREEQAMLLRRELWRFALAGFLWTTALFLLLWYWGEWRRLGVFFKSAGAAQGPEAQPSGKIEPGLTGRKISDGREEAQGFPPVSDPVCEKAGRSFQRRNRGAWPMTACLFRQTFAGAPQLIERLYAADEVAALCHVGRLLEKAAPLVGASGLAEAARAMQDALNDPGAEGAALATEALGAELRAVLAALGGEHKEN